MMILKLLLNTEMICKMLIKNIEAYNQGKKGKVLIVSDDMIADIFSNKKLNPVVVTELFIRGRKINILLVFITQSYFNVPKLYTFFYYENSKQERPSTNCNQLFISHRF